MPSLMFGAKYPINIPHIPSSSQQRNAMAPRQGTERNISPPSTGGERKTSRPWRGVEGCRWSYPSEPQKNNRNKNASENPGIHPNMHNSHRFHWLPMCPFLSKWRVLSSHWPRPSEATTTLRGNCLTPWANIAIPARAPSPPHRITAGTRWTKTVAFFKGFIGKRSKTPWIKVPDKVVNPVLMFWVTTCFNFTLNDSSLDVR